MICITVLLNIFKYIKDLIEIISFFILKCKHKHNGKIILIIVYVLLFKFLKPVTDNYCSRNQNKISHNFENKEI